MISLKTWGEELLEQLSPLADILDDLKNNTEYSVTLEQMKGRIKNPDLCPSAQMLEEMRLGNQSFVDWSMAKARQHHQFYLQQELSISQREQLDRLSKISLDKQKAIESTQDQSLDEYIQSYFNQYQQL
ncbi:MAG: hypothetical protein ACFHHU_04955 [Porticoccaceae bacterium]